MEVYNNEKQAFDGLRQHTGVVQCLADFTHKETRNTYNILLEFGELDLDEFFAERLPPAFQVETEAFWKDLFEVADALEGIHNLKVNVNGNVEEYHG